VLLCLACAPGLQSFGVGNITVISPRSTLITGPIEINVPVEDGRTGAPGKQPLCMVWQSVGEESASDMHVSAHRNGPDIAA
jgi:hypothetical protein